MKRVNIGDIHAMRNAPHMYSTRAFFNFLLNSEINTPDVTLCFLGDVVHSSHAEPSVVALWLWFVSEYKGLIEILSGNHDESAESGENFLDIFNDCQNVTTYRELTEVKHGNLSILMMPFYRTNSLSDRKPMKEVYEKVTGVYDFIHLHIELTPIFSKGLTLDKKLEGTIRCGHIHTGSPCGTYLPSVNPTSTTEKDVKTYLEIVDCETKTVEKWEIPRFLNYVRVDYPNPLPELPTDNDEAYLVDVYEGLDRKDVQSTYANDFCKENIFLHKVYKKTYIQDKDAEMYRSTVVQTKTKLEFFKELSEKKKYSDELVDYITPFVK